MVAVSEPYGLQPQARPIRVMLVDDSVVVRSLIGRWLSENGGFEVVAACRSATIALAIFEDAQPDVVLLDIEMPDLDGLAALPRFLALGPHCAVVMLSSLASTQADIALRCVERGAADFIAKPGRTHEFVSSRDFEQALIQKLTALGLQIIESGARRRPATRSAPVPAPDPGAGATNVMRFPAAVPRPAVPPPPAIRPARRPGLIVVGASTGGPSAVLALLEAIKPVIRRLPVVVVQHMPATFTPIFADHLTRQVGMDAHEIRDRELIVPGQVYIAPGGRHLQVAGQRGGIRAVLDDGPAINFCKPSVDVLFHSAAQMLGSAVIGVVLTGMGTDGASGAGAIHAAGGAVFAQDEASSVVWGMPGTVYRTGICQGIGTVPELGRLVCQAVGVEPTS